jgi:hypothetical protein
MSESDSLKTDEIKELSLSLRYFYTERELSLMIPNI